MKLHKRTMKVQGAEVEIGSALWNLQQEHGLTYAEMTKVLLGHLDRIATYQLREERHPGRPDRKADEA